MLLYFRMILTMLVTLYTSRVVLNTLGVEDFGIFNVVGGIVVIFSFLNLAMSSATQRFLSFELGKKNLAQFARVFSMSINIHALIALIIFVLAETIGLWFVNTHLVIPTERMVAANWVYQCAILSFMVTVMSVPYNASIIAHERMGVFAYISILEVSLKLLIVFILQWLTFDKLKLYAVLLLIVSVVIRVIYGIYCKAKLEGCQYVWVKDKALFKILSSYAGWNLWGNLAGVGMDQGVNILLNVFFGPVVNAARGIAYQVGAAIHLFVANFQVAVNPQIVKSYASKDYDYMYTLIYKSSKYSYYLLLFLSLPVFFETEYILNLWLGEVPNSAALFTKLVLVAVLIDCLSGSLMAGAQASGRIKVYQSVVGGLLLLIVPFSFFGLKLYGDPIVPFYINIIVLIIALFCRLLILKNLIKLSIYKFLEQVLLPVILVTVLSVVMPYYIKSLFNISFFRLMLISLATSFSVLCSIFIVGMTKGERAFILNKIRHFAK
nr:lipopolysaccharide biosynthesis protein [Bacteroides coprosuis]